MNSVKQAEKYLESLIPKDLKTPKRIMRLERIRALLDLLESPQDKFFPIHIGGTSGKGSTAVFLSFILQGTGFRVGLTLSPHVETIRERIQINNMNIPEKDFVKLINKIRPNVEEVKKQTDFGRPTYFEVLIAGAFEYFAQKGVDFGVVEVGLGGKLDATNVLASKIQVLTSVELDHTEILGDSIEKIAKDKIEIIKPQGFVVSGIKQSKAKKILKTKCKRLKAKLYLLREDFGFRIRRMDLTGSVFDFWFGKEKLKGLSTSLLGGHQVENASLALGVVFLLRGLGYKVTDRAIKCGFKKAFIPGRFEIIEQKPLVVLDGAHNASKIKVFLKALKAFNPKKRKLCILAIKETKNIEEMVRQLAKQIDVFICAAFKSGQEGRGSFDPKELARVVKKFSSRDEVFVEKDSRRAFEQAKKMAKKKDVICVTGSLYLVGEVRKLIEIKNRGSQALI